MSAKIIIILIPALLFALACPSHAWWFEYTTYEDNLPVAADSVIDEREPIALPFTGDGTLVVFYRNFVGNSYQIIDRYGELKFPEPQLLRPSVVTGVVTSPKVVSDSSGGVFACWRDAGEFTTPGHYAQRIDSLGNLCWGDSAKLISLSTVTGFDVSADGYGGFFLTMGTGDIWAQHVNSDGQPSWGDSGVVVISHEGSQNSAKVTHDGSGGAYIVWDDQRPEYYPYGALFMQRLHSNGTPWWETDGRFICEYTQFHQLLPDGENGFLLHTNPNSSYSNSVFRIAPMGLILWEREGVSWYYWAKMVPGEPGFIYLGFEYQEDVWGQRMDINGHTYWPEPGSLQGAVMESSIYETFNRNRFAYRYPYFYSVHSLARYLTMEDRWMYAQKLDSLGRRQWGEAGAALSHFYGSEFYSAAYYNCVPDEDGGVVAVCEIHYYGNQYDILAKRCDSRGNLGGPDPRRRPLENYPQISGISDGRIHFEIPASGRVKVDLYNLLGQYIGTIENAYLQAGKHSVTIDQSDLVSGIYFVRIKTPQGVCAGKVVVVR